MSKKQPIKESVEVNSDFLDMDQDEDNQLNPDPVLQGQLDKKGLAHRWLNKKHYLEDGNYHRSGWVAYRVTESEDRGPLEFKYGVSPEGYITRRDLILGVMPKEKHARLKARKKAAADRLFEAVKPYVE